MRCCAHRVPEIRSNLIAMKTKFISIAAIHLVAVAAAACGDGAVDADQLNKSLSGGTSASGGSASAQGGSGLPTGTAGELGSGGSAPSGAGGAGGTSASTGGSPGTAGSSSAGTGGLSPLGTGGSVSSDAGGSTTVATGGSVASGGAMDPTAGGGGDVAAAGGTAAAGAANGGGGGGGGEVATGPYAPRTGPFKMLVYSQVIGTAYRHPSIQAGQRMLQAIGEKQGFEVTIATNESEINPEGLAQYEIVFFMNSTGELFNAGNQRKDFEDWIRNDGAYGGMHGATDAAQSWDFYKEMTGQYYDGHDPCCANAQIQWTVAGQNHVVGKGLPNPWSRSEEWYRFNRQGDWSTKAGFTILSTVQTAAGGTRPVSYVREWGNFRAFYTSIGHEEGPYTNADVIKHVAAGIMWAVRREALIVP